MKTRYVLALSTVAAAALANAAPFTDMPAAGEMPFMLSSPTASSLSRAEVQAGAATTPPRSGDVPYIEDSAQPTVLARAVVAAAAVATPPAAGESYYFATSALPAAWTGNRVMAQAENAAPDPGTETPATSSSGDVMPSDDGKATEPAAPQTPLADDD